MQNLEQSTGTQAAQVALANKAFENRRGRYHDDSLLTTQQLAAEIHSSPRTLEGWRMKGSGPPFSYIGHRAIYRWGDCLAWIKSRRVASTSEEIAA